MAFVDILHMYTFMYNTHTYNTSGFCLTYFLPYILNCSDIFPGILSAIYLAVSLAFSSGILSGIYSFYSNILFRILSGMR